MFRPFLVGFDIGLTVTENEVTASNINPLHPAIWSISQGMTPSWHCPKRHLRTQLIAGIMTLSHVSRLCSRHDEHPGRKRLACSLNTQLAFCLPKTLAAAQGARSPASVRIVALALHTTSGFKFFVRIVKNSCTASIWALTIICPLLLGNCNLSPYCRLQT